MPKKYSTFLGQGQLRGKNEKKSSDQLGDAMPTSIYLQFTEAAQVFYGEFPKIPWNTPVIGNYISKAILVYLV